MTKGMGTTVLAAGVLAVALSGGPDEPARAQPKGFHIDMRDKYCLRERNAQGVPSSVARIIDSKTNQTVLNADFSLAGPSVPVIPTTAAGENLPDRRAVLAAHDNLAVDYRATGHREIYTCVSQRLDLQKR